MKSIFIFIHVVNWVFPALFVEENVFCRCMFLAPFQVHMVVIGAEILGPVLYFMYQHV